MAELWVQACEACRAGAPAITQEQLAEWQPQIPLWNIIERSEIMRLERVFKFRNFAQALAFTNQVGELSASEGHHPALLTEWGKVTVSWWTHKVKGLHRNDFIMAAKTDALYEGRIRW